MQGEKITLIGAGLVGSLLSIYLAKRGYRVEILERRPDMRREEVSAGRSINLALSTRGIRALEKLGLAKDVLSRAIAMRGRGVHLPDGGYGVQSYGQSDSECIYSISRNDLNQTLMSAAEKTGQIHIRFNQRVTSVDLETREIEVEGPGLSRECRPAPVLIGTDGSASALRTAMERRLGFESSTSTLEHGYKELTLPAAADGGFQLDKHALHIWPRATYMLIALPNVEGSFTCTLFLPFEGRESFAELRTPDQVRAFFEAHFPDVLPRFPKLTEEFFSHPTGKMITVKCAPWNVGGDALLMGDSAHAIVPFFGQGMNSGFEDCLVLDRAIEHAGGDLRRAFDQFSRSRKPDTDAIADLALENFVEMRDKVADPAFQFERRIERILQREFPGEYLTRYQLVTFSQVPYSVALRAGRIQQEILVRLGSGITDPERIDLQLAGQLLRTKLSPVVQPAIAGSELPG